MDDKIQNKQLKITKNYISSKFEGKIVKNFHCNEPAIAYALFQI